MRLWPRIQNAENVQTTNLAVTRKTFSTRMDADTHSQQRNRVPTRQYTCTIFRTALSSSNVLGGAARTCDDQNKSYGVAGAKRSDCRLGVGAFFFFFFIFRTWSYTCLNKEVASVRGCCYIRCCWMMFERKSLMPLAPRRRQAGTTWCWPR